MSPSSPVVLIAGLALLQAAPSPEAGPAVPADGTNPFFAFCMDTHDSEKRTLPEQAALLKELGYDGVGHLWLDGVDERLKTLDAVGLKLFQIYLRATIAADKPPFDPRLKDVLPLLKDRGVMLAVLIGGGSPSDPAGDARAAAIVRDIADLAAPWGVRVALYPHANDWLERVEDAVRVARKAGRPNVGVMWNLCHWLKVDEEENLTPLLSTAMPYLYAVSIHGADRAAEIRAGTGDWIQPLGEGTFDMCGFLRTLSGLGYRGPVGLQCWGIGGDARDHLAKSIAAWRELAAYGPAVPAQ